MPGDNTPAAEPPQAAPPLPGQAWDPIHNGIRPSVRCVGATIVLKWPRGRCVVRTILLDVEDDASLDARMQSALSLARATGGHVTCGNTQ